MARVRFPADLAYSAASYDNAPMKARTNLLLPMYLSAEGADLADASDLADVVSATDGSPFDGSAVPVLSGLRLAFDGPADGTEVLWTVVGGVVQRVQGYPDVTAGLAVEAAARDAAISAGLSSKANSSTVTAGLASKADLTATAASLALKADAAATTTALAAKLDTATASGTYAPLVSPALTGSPTVNGAPISTGSGAVSSVAGKTGAVTLAKADVGLSSVDNTADSAKPVSTAQAAAIAALTPSLAQYPMCYVSPSGSDSANGLTPATPKATIQAAVTALRSSPGYGVVHLLPGTHPLTASLTVYQGISIVGLGFGSMAGAGSASGGSEIVYSGPDSGYAIVTAASDSTDWTWGVLRGVRLTCATTKPGGGAYSTVGGLYARNVQNLTQFQDVLIQKFPGVGLYSDDSQATATNTMPGVVEFTRVWCTGNGVNWQVRAGYTACKWELCKADAANDAAPIQTTSAFIIDPPLGSSAVRGGKDGVFVFDGLTMEMQTADANMLVVNTDIGLVLDGFSATRPTPGTKAAIQYLAVPGSANVTAGTIPVEINQAHTTNIPSLLRAPNVSPAIDLVIPNSTGGETYSQSWSGQRKAGRWDGSHTLLAADRIDLSGTDATKTLLKAVPAPGQTANTVEVGGATFTDTVARADSTSSPGTADTGQVWSKLGGAGGALGIISGKLYAPSPGAGVDVTYTVDDGSADFTYTTTFVLSSTAGRYNVSQVFRAIDQNNYLRATLVNNQLLLVKNVAGVNSTLATSGQTLAASGTYVLKSVATGSAIAVSMNGTQLISYTLTSGELATFGTSSLKGVRISTGTSGNTDDGGSRIGPLYASATAFRVTATGVPQKLVSGTWTDLATGSVTAGFDLRYQSARQSTALEAMTGTPINVTTGAVTAGVVYLVKLRLTAGARTTVEHCLSAAGGTLSNTYLGIYDTSTLGLLATSADVSTTYQTVGQRTATLNYTAASEMDVWLAFLIGAGTTMPTFVTHSLGTSIFGIVRGIANRHTTTGLTALPATLSLQNAASANGVLAPWTAYR